LPLDWQDVYGYRPVLENGVDIKTIQETLGHHSAAAFTMDAYSNVTSKMKREAADKVGNLLASLMEK